MNLSEFFIKRPVFAIILNLMILLIGYLSFKHLPVSEYPNIVVPVLSVEARYPNASVDVVESALTNILEKELAAVAGIDTITSTSAKESSQITIQFTSNTDIDTAIADVRERISSAMPRLPIDVKLPTIKKFDQSAEAFLYISLSSNQMRFGELTHYAATHLSNMLTSIKGVAQVQLWGPAYSMDIMLDQHKMLAKNITIEEVVKIINERNAMFPAGQFQDKVDTSMNLLLSHPEDFENLVLKVVNNYPIYLRDIATVQLGSQQDFRMKIKGKPAMVMAVYKTSDSNQLEVSDLVTKRIEQIKSTLPNDITITIEKDNSDFIRTSLSNIKHSIIEAVVLVVFVIFLFLGNVRACIIPLVTIPIALIGSFALMEAFNSSINVLTMLAMVLAVGLVVDDAIVVLENIYRHLEKGATPREAAILGSKEILFAIIAMTSTLASVYLPIAFSSDISSKIFAEFAVTLAGSVIISGVISIVLSPMMCSRILTAHNTSLIPSFEKALEKITNYYRNLLDIILSRSWIAASLIAGIIFSMVMLITFIKKEIAPQEDRGLVMAHISPLAGGNADSLEPYLNQVESLLSNEPESANMLSFVWSGGAMVVLPLKPIKDRDISAAQLADKLRAKIKIPTVDIAVLSIDSGLPMMGNGGMNNLQFLIETTDSYKNLYDLSNKLKSKIDESKKFSYVNLDLSLNDPYYDLKIDQVKMVKYGLAPAQISSLVQLFFSGIKTLEFLKDQERYRILLKTKSNPWNLSEIYIRSQDNKMVPLDNFVKLNQVVGANSLKHYNQMRNATISVQLNSDQNMPEAMKLINELAAEIIPIEYRTEWGGAAKFQNESSNTMLFLIMLSLVFIYAILAIQFESFISPMIIMFTAPLACCGALLLLKLSGQSLNIFTQVGIITLIGLITKHGILLVEFANQLVEQGVEIKEAIKHSAITRFRPILMTSGAMIFGSISLIIARGDGAEIRQAIGTVLVGGLGFGTILTLLIIPSLYLWVKKIKIS